MKNKDKAIAALLSSNTQAEAAAKCGISDRTLRAYLLDQDFSTEYQKQKHRLVTEATRQIQTCYQAAINALRDIVENDSTPDSVRISAARAILEFGLKFTEMTDIMTRLENLEKVING